MKVVEMCCGYGGATEGLLRAGLTVEASYDIWPVAVQQHLAWHPGTPCEVRDVATITPDELAGRLVWASLPCQPYSTANRYAEKRGKKHPHYYSLAHFARQVQHARLALIENVPGLVWSKEGRAELLELERECARLGLGMSIHLVYSHWFGVSQWRRRVFILIGRDLPLVLIQPGSAPASVDEWAVTATEGKGGPGPSRPTLETAVTAHRREGIGGSWPARGGQMESAVTCNPVSENIHSSKRVKKADIATVMASNGSGVMTQQAGQQGRTIARCAELQGCPVPLGVTKSDAYTLIGNMVPPLLAEAVARQVFTPLLGVPA